MNDAPRKIALVTDWLTDMGDQEQLLLALHALYPRAPIYTSVYDRKKMTTFRGCDVRTTTLQKTLPRFLRYKHDLWPAQRIKAFRTLDLSEFDIIISVSSAEAKAIKKTRPDQVHIAYVTTPNRTYWTHPEEFKRNFDVGELTWLVKLFIPLFVRKMRKLDLETIPEVDIFIANSTVTQSRIKQYYDRPSTVVHPPVAIDRFTPPPKTDRQGYIIWGQHLAYKRFDIAVRACNKLQLPLTVIGDGPTTEQLKEIAGPTITFTGHVSDAELVDRAQHAKAFLSPSEEDFGISAAEALAAGTPVIAYGKGGIQDIIQDGETGILFKEQTVDSLVAAIKRFQDNTFLPATLHRKSKRFASSLFSQKISKIVSDSM